MYTLTININTQGRQFLIDNKQQIAIVFPTDSDHAIACLSFSPFGALNIVAFQDSWFEFASPQTINDNETITMNLIQDVNVANTYTFNGVGFINNGTAPGNQYGLINKSTFEITAGLGQSISVNETDAVQSAVNIMPLPQNQATYFEPGTKIWIFTASGIDSNMVFPSQILFPTNTNNATSKAITLGGYIEVDLADNPSITYNSQTNAFTD